METVSVIIPTWNRAATIGAAVQSVLEGHADQAAVLASPIEKGEAGRFTVGFTAVADYDLLPRIISAAQQAL